MNTAFFVLTVLHLDDAFVNLMCGMCGRIVNVDDFSPQNTDLRSRHIPIWDTCFQYVLAETISNHTSN